MSDEVETPTETDETPGPGAGAPLIVECFPVGPLACNCTLVGDPSTGKALVVDPGGDPDDIVARLERHGLKLTLLLHTHAHIDHILATREMRERTGARIELHEDDLVLYQGLIDQARMLRQWGMPLPDPSEPLPVERFLKDGEEIGFGELSMEVLHTPGHTEGSCCFGFRSGEKEVLIAGDTLFRGSVGRTDLAGGDTEKLVRSIKDRLYRRDEETEVLTGHGEATTIGFERRQNGFVRG